MGGNIALLLSSHGIDVVIIDKTEDNVKRALKNAENEKLSR
jgi:Trk K+ transport system NAD-binding subunit